MPLPLRFNNCFSFLNALSDIAGATGEYSSTVNINNSWVRVCFGALNISALGQEKYKKELIASHAFVLLIGN